MSDLVFNICIGAIVVAALGILVWMSWPSKINLDAQEDEHARNPFRW